MRPQPALVAPAPPCSARPVTPPPPAALVVPLSAVGLTDEALVGGKAARLGGVARLEGLRVPGGSSPRSAV